MGHSLVPIRITARVIRRFQNNIFRRAIINMAESLRVHSLIARVALHSRASAGCNFGQTAGPSLIKFGTREGGREGGRGGRGGEGRGGREGRGGQGRAEEGRAGQGMAGQGRAGQGRAGQGRAGQGREGRGGEGRGGQGRAGQGRAGDCPHFPQTRTFVTAEPSRTPASRVTG